MFTLEYMYIHGSKQFVAMSNILLMYMFKKKKDHAGLKHLIISFNYI